MFRRRTRPVLGSLVLALVLGAGEFAGCPAAVAAVPEPRLLINQDFADPDVLKTDSGYYAYSTSSGATKIRVATAAAAEGPWTVGGDVLARIPSWAKPDAGFWAPDVTRRPDGTYLMYFAGLASNGMMCVGTATALLPQGPFEPSGDQPLVCPPEDHGDIDAQTFFDEDGARYLLYRSLGTPTGPPAALWLQRVDTTGLRLVGPRTELLRADLVGEHSVVEAPLLVKLPSKYVLFYSADTFQSSGYHTAYASAPALTGVFVKADGVLLSTDGLAGKAEGPGGADVVAGHIFFHGWLNHERKARGLYELPISFPGDVPQLG